MSKNADNRGAENQRTLFSYVKKIYPNLEVLYEFLLPNGMRYDIFVPALGICIEYDGEQHTNYIEHFHKDLNGYMSSIKSDIKKDDISDKHGVKVVRINYDSMVNSSDELMEIIESVDYPSSEYDMNYFFIHEKKESDFTSKMKDLKKKRYQEYKSKLKNK